MEVSFSPRDTACSGILQHLKPLWKCLLVLGTLHVVALMWHLTKCLYFIVETIIMSLATKNNVSTGYFSCSGRKEVVDSSSNQHIAKETNPSSEGKSQFIQHTYRSPSSSPSSSQGIHCGSSSIHHVRKGTNSALEGSHGSSNIH
jgi:hypothetical protein